MYYPQKINKVIWVEGIFLSQQHFQQWDRYWERQLQYQAHAIAPLVYGIQQLQIDEAALMNGQFRIRKLRAILPNGQNIYYEYNINQLLTCQLNMDHAVIDIYLCVPDNQNVSGITGYDNAHVLAAYKALYENVSDEFDTNRQREVLFGDLNLSLAQTGDSLEQFCYLKIAEVIRDPKQNYQWRQDFIPALVNIQASAHLQQLLSNWIELLTAVTRLLNERRHSFNGDVTEFGQNNFEQFILLQTLMRALVSLQHLNKHPTAHPQQLYLSCIDLLGSLGVFSTAFSLNQIPYFQQNNLSQTFNTIDHLLRDIINNVIPMRMTSLRLRRESETLYVVDHLDKTALNKIKLFIAVFFSTIDSQWQQQFAKQIKVGAISALDSILISALPGVKLNYMQRPPTRLPIKTGYEYFYLEPTGNFWEQVISERTLGIFVPFNFAQAQLDLVTLEE